MFAHAMFRTSSEDLYQKEILYTRAKIMAAPHNESAWNYLRGLCTSLGLEGKMATDGSLYEVSIEVRPTPWRLGH